MIKGYYINLNYRIDRRQHFETLKQENDFFKNIERMDAIYSETYGVGCMLSHIKCLTEVSKLNQNHYLIMEDDFCILRKNNFNDFVKEFEKIKDDDDWDIITLTPRGKTEKRNYKENFHKIIDTQCATAYIIKHEFVPKLLNIYKEGVVQLMRGYTGPEPNPYCTDQCWKPIQLESNWLYFYKIFGGQVPSYSDIEKRVVDYNERFVQQGEF